MLIPVDFTDTSRNTISYAVEWSKAYGYNHIILLKTLYDSYFDNLIPSADYMHVSKDYMVKEREEATEQLNVLCRELIARFDPAIKVSMAIGELPLLRSVLEVVEEEKPELIVLGSDHQSYSSDSFIANSIISIARVSPVRVLIVPSDCRYQPVRQALVPCDFNTVHTLSKLDHYQASSPLWKEKKLLVLNVDPKERYLRPDEHFRKAADALHRYLFNFQHEVFYSNNKNIINGIMHFSAEHDIEIIIALPGEHSFLYSLTHKSISEALYRNSQKPVLILK